MSLSPWLSIVLLGVAITGYAWMMPKQARSDKTSEFQGEAAYEQLLEDLEAENRELIDAVAKFKREQDETVDKLNRRVVDMEHQMKLFSLQASAVPQAAIARTELASASVPEVGIDPVQPQEKVVAPADVPVVSPIETKPSVPTVDLSIRGRYQDLLSLHDKGRSVEQIAKSLGMNKGEVQLILQLARREEEQHA